MSNIQIYDPVLCCSSGVCGVDVDQQLVNVAANIEWAKQNGAHIERFNLGQEPLAFAEQPLIKTYLERFGEKSLPVMLVDGEIAIAGRYPTREELARVAGITLACQPEPGCCPGKKCC